MGEWVTQKRRVTFCHPFFSPSLSLFFFLHFLSLSTAAGGIILLPHSVLTRRICTVAGFRQFSRLSFIIIGKEGGGLS